MTHPFVDHLYRLSARDDRAALAALRRGLGKPPGTVPAMYPILMPFIPEEDNRPGRDDVYYLVASLYALNPVREDDLDLGAMYERLGGNSSTESRFRALLQADRDQLASHLRQAMSLARSGKRRTGLDWQLLLHHLRGWDHPDAWVQRTWARSFWRPSTSSSP